MISSNCCWSTAVKLNKFLYKFEDDNLLLNIEGIVQGGKLGRLLKLYPKGNKFRLRIKKRCLEF
jgi:hypothetical protein